ncbi:hypothetical protein ACHWQZ_G013518 [Mnemiopsis leidyi]
MSPRSFDKIVYTVCVLNVLICLVMAPLQIFYITPITPWQEDCSWILLLCAVICSGVFACAAVLHIYIFYNKQGRHWSGLNKNMRFLVVMLFVLFFQIIGILYAKYRLKKRNEVKFKSAEDDYYSTSSSRPYIDKTQTAGKCCGYYSKDDWFHVTKPLPPSCCVDKDITCTYFRAFSRGCQAYFGDLIRNGTDAPVFTTAFLLLTSLLLYVSIMTYLQFSGRFEYEEIHSTSQNFESSVVEGTHQSWRSSRLSLNNDDIVPTERATRSRDTGYGSRDLLVRDPQVIVSRDSQPRQV